LSYLAVLLGFFRANNHRPHPNFDCIVDLHNDPLPDQGADQPESESDEDYSGAISHRAFCGEFPSSFSDQIRDQDVVIFPCFCALNDIRARSMQGLCCLHIFFEIIFFPLHGLGFFFLNSGPNFI
jgi:hypothetical protein